jgi:2-polyprenyl-6-hydroxyphenyl methylase/3-demethylubiquinone-9 3-methyltransferase
MEKIDAEIFARIDNNVYKAQGDIWWKPDSMLNLIKTSLNPWRIEYADIIFKRLGFDAKGKSALEVGSGGGILCEEIARMGFTRPE